MSVMNLRPKRELFEEIARIMGIGLQLMMNDYYVNAGNGVY
jgi:hypothetical protein